MTIDELKTLTDEDIRNFSTLKQQEVLKMLAKEIDDADSRYNYNKAMQLGLKLVLNGTYGAFAHPKFIVSNKHIANAITKHGRDVILFMLQKIEKYFYDIWHLDTETHKLLSTKYIAHDDNDVWYMLNYKHEQIEWSHKSLAEVLRVWNINFSNIEKIDEEKITTSDDKNLTICYKRFIHDFKHLRPLDKTVTRERDKMDGYDIDFHQESVIVYGDTDSLYLSYKPIMDSCHYEGDELEFILNIDKLFVKGLFKEYLDEYAKTFKVKNVHDFELETINKSGLHVEKKMYLNNTVWEDGIFFNDLSNFIPKGIDIVRSSTPAFVRGTHGEPQQEGIWRFIRYIFENPESLNVRDVLQILKDLKKEYILMGSTDLDAVAMTSTLSNYSKKIVDDQNTYETVKGAHFSVKAACLHNFVLNKNPEYKTRIDLLRGGKVKWYFCKGSELNDRLAYLRGFHPDELCKKEGIEVDWDIMFEKAMLSIVNKFNIPIGLPNISKRLSVLNSIFGHLKDASVKVEEDEDDYADEIWTW